MWHDNILVVLDNLNQAAKYLPGAQEWLQKYCLWNLQQRPPECAISLFQLTGGEKRAS